MLKKSIHLCHFSVKKSFEEVNFINKNYLGTFFNVLFSVLYIHINTEFIFSCICKAVRDAMMHSNTKNQCLLINLCDSFHRHEPVMQCKFIAVQSCTVIPTLSQETVGKQCFYNISKWPSSAVAFQVILTRIKRFFYRSSPTSKLIPKSAGNPSKPLSQQSSS